MQTWFEEWFDTPYYHELYAGRDSQEASAFVDQLIQYLKPAPGSVMLDVACGSGRHAIELADKGFDVTGIDLSQQSIEQALAHQHEHLHFYVHDMRLPFRINYYHYAFNFFTSFGYFRTQREHDNAIRTIAQSLQKNGMFVMDYLNVHYAEDHLQHQSEQMINGNQYLVSKWFDESHFYKKISIESEGMDLPLVFTEKVAKFSLGDFTDMFSYQGLQIREVFGDYNFARYDIRQSPRLIMIAEKIR